AIGEDTELVLHLFGPIHADSNANGIPRQVLDDGGRKQRRVGGQAEVNLDLQFLSTGSRVGYHVLKQGEIHQRFPTEKSNVDAFSSLRLGKEVIDRALRRLPLHELGFTLGGRY